MALAALFPNRLPENFAESFNPELYGTNSDSTVSPKKELLTLLAEHPEQRAEIIATWKQLFPGDEWARDLK